MANKCIWMVRAGRGAEYVDDFLEVGLVAIGFDGAGDVSSDTDKAEVEANLAKANPSDSKGKNAMSAAQIKRYYSEIGVGDAVTTYDPSQRIYFLGEVLSDVEHRDHALNRVRRVKWTHKVARDSLTTSTRNTLGAISTLFLVRDDAAADMWAHAKLIESQIEEAGDTVASLESTDDDKFLMEEAATKANEFIEDRIARLDWEQMQDLVAEILTAMGYRARVSPKGADRGVDVFASPDGLGLQEPRIFAEVKHRPGTTISADQVRAFLGGRQPGDRCLYVSTGGFTKDARYEAERSSIPITLITLPQLRELVVEYYDSLRPTGASLIPLQRIYWPSS